MMQLRTLSFKNVTDYLEKMDAEVTPRQALLEMIEDGDDLNVLDEEFRRINKRLAQAVAYTSVSMFIAVKLGFLRSIISNAVSLLSSPSWLLVTGASVAFTVVGMSQLQETSVMPPISGTAAPAMSSGMMPIGSEPPNADAGIDGRSKVDQDPALVIHPHRRAGHGRKRLLRH